MKETAQQFFLNGLEASNPSQLIKNSISVNKDAVFIHGKALKSGSKSVYIIAVGKASRPMAKTLKNLLGVKKSNILCVTLDDDAKEAYCVPSSHPVPDQKSRDAADKLLQFIRDLSAKSLVFFALSGGTSAMICKPAEGLSLEDLNRLNDLLLHSGAAIEEINGVRKHVSMVKGGQLLTCFKQDCTLIDLVISDVPDDDLEIIGSGLTIPDSSTFQDAYDTLLRYGLWEKVPQSIHTHIEKGLTGEVPETIKPGEDPLAYHQSYIIGSASTFAKSIADEAQQKGYTTWVADRAFNQPVEEVTEYIAAKIREYQPAKEPTALVFYGESTVEVKGKGKGGRNQELALRGALKIEGMEGVTWLSAGTDGIDGPTDAAGAIVDGSTIESAKKKGLSAEEFIRDNDSYHFHEQMGTLLKTGPTGNNLMDVVIVMIV